MHWIVIFSEGSDGHSSVDAHSEPLSTRAPLEHLIFSSGPSVVVIVSGCANSLSSVFCSGWVTRIDSFCAYTNIPPNSETISIVGRKTIAGILTVVIHSILVDMIIINSWHGFY
jgi:hypothetical protein